MANVPPKPTARKPRTIAGTLGEAMIRAAAPRPPASPVPLSSKPLDQVARDLAEGAAAANLEQLDAAASELRRHHDSTALASSSAGAPALAHAILDAMARGKWDQAGALSWLLTSEIERLSQLAKPKEQSRDAGFGAKKALGAELTSVAEMSEPEQVFSPVDINGGRVTWRAKHWRPLAEKLTIAVSHSQLLWPSIRPDEVTEAWFSSLTETVARALADRGPTTPQAMVRCALGAMGFEQKLIKSLFDADRKKLAGAAQN